MRKVLIAVPMGDPAGIGPEIVVKAVSKKEIQDIARVLVVGDGQILEKAKEICKLPLKLKRYALLPTGREDSYGRVFLWKGQCDVRSGSIFLY